MIILEHGLQQHHSPASYLGSALCKSHIAALSYIAFIKDS